MEYLHLEVSNNEIDGASRRVTHLYEDNSSKKIEIFYEFDRIVKLLPGSVLDGHVFAILLYACARGKPLKVHGTLSHMAMRNLEELQLIWQMWKPDIYRRVDIIPDNIDDTRKIRKEKAISAFSGGADAMFTALRHTKSLADKFRYPLSSALMVHGFDVDIYNHADFKNLVKRVKPFLDYTDIELRTIRTNSREIKIQNWEYSHGLELAACLHMFADEFEYGLIGSSGPYQGFVMPWGSNPVTDHFISGTNFSVKYDGAGFFRTDKMEELLKHPIACQTLKVCYTGIDQSVNCGKCEKCVRSQLNFFAAGAKTTPSCFENEFDVSCINEIKISHLGQLVEMHRIANRARKNNVKGEWLTLLNERIKQWDSSPPELHTEESKVSVIKNALATIITNVGLEEPAKKLWRSIRRNIS